MMKIKKKICGRTCMNKNVKSIICRYGLFINIFITIKLTLNSFIPTLNFKICRYIPQLTKQYSNIIMRILDTVIKKKFENFHGFKIT